MSTEQGRKPTVLILGEDTRSFLSVIRALGEAGYAVHVVCYDRTSPALSSRYITMAKFYNYQAYSQSQWLEAVQQLIERYQFDVIIPCDERSIYPLWSVKETLPEKTKLAIANDIALTALFDKWKTKQLAIACDVPIAHGRLVTLSEESYPRLAHEFGDSFVIKPLQSFDEEGLNKRQNVSIIHNDEDFNQVSPAADTVMVEAFFSGCGEGLSVFSVDGHLQMAFSHQREAEPKHGGGSSYRKSIPHDPDQLAAVAAMCRETTFTGVAMFEFRRNPDTRSWILVEVNARFWGSLPLAAYCGVDFPAVYAQYLLDGQLPSQPIMTYPLHRYARALTADFYQLRRESGIRTISQRLMQYGRIALGRERIDSFTWRDPVPFLREVMAIAEQIALGVCRRFPLLLKYRSVRTQSRLKALFKANPRRRILFICYGNIMRSPFAEQVCKSLFERDMAVCDVESFGFHVPENRQSPEEAQAAAQHFNYRLDQHRSKCLRQCDLLDDDIVFYFDERNGSTIAASYDIANAFCLADLIPLRAAMQHEVADPYGHGMEGVTTCYTQIERAIAYLLRCYQRDVYGR
ncbi:hypothetical protein L4C36_03250 [Photobacterium japonica]|uniref:arsenate reductase/protein-tyrosine-phosphatase family protein n=1 Tax=Photobacterium japonica TaxID=2910235 RepID=UPI003D0D595D